MAFAGINYLALTVAAAAALLASIAWYTLLGRIGAAPLKQPFKAGGMTGASLPHVVAVAGYVLISYTLAGLLGHLGPGQVTLTNGIVSGGFVWFGFVLTTMAINYSYAGGSWARLAIHAGNWLIALIVIGAVLGTFGV